MTCGGWKYAAASVVGTAHQKFPDGECQDAHALDYVQRLSAFVGVVSDGAGSASQAQRGSRLACDFVLERVAETSPALVFSRALADKTLDGLRGTLRSLASNDGFQIRDFACTLLVAIICPDQSVFWQMGDGAMCFRQQGEDRFKYAFWPEKGDYANVTYFVTDENAKDHLDFDITDGEIVELGMFSDGLERLALDFAAGEAHSGFFKGLFPHMHSLPAGRCDDLSLQIANFLASERVNRRTDDDKTLILASRIP
ncbi:MAG: PP2C family serine/threonine-protein phosphatase [Bryobacteraceae bacterium]